MQEHVSDRYVRKAKEEGYRSRAAFKLRELAQQDRLILPGMTVVDLGSTPGGWSQIATEMVGPKGRVVAVDILEMAAVPGVEFIQGDFRDAQTLDRLEQLLGERQVDLVDLVLSDMSPNISGIGMVDQARAAHLAELALEFSLKWLKPGGNLLVKTFQGESFSGIREQMRRSFRRVVARKPDASRSRSPEMYLLGLEIQRLP